MQTFFDVHYIGGIVLHRSAKLAILKWGRFCSYGGMVGRIGVCGGGGGGVIKVGVSLFVVVVSFIFFCFCYTVGDLLRGLVVLFSKEGGGGVFERLTRVF